MPTTPNPVPRDRALPVGLSWRGSILHIDVLIDGRRYCRSTRTGDLRRARAQLEALRTRAEAERAAGPIDPAGRSWGDFLAHALPRLTSEGLAVRSIAKLGTAGRMFARFLVERNLTGLPLRAITRAHIEDYRGWALATPRSRNGHPCAPHHPPALRTVCNELDMLRILFRRAVRWGLLTDHPDRFVARMKGAYEPRTRWLSDDEIGRILGACRTLRRRLVRRIDLLAGAVFRLLLHTGLRLGELQHARLSDVRFLPDGRQALRVGSFTVPCTLTVLRWAGEEAAPPEQVLHRVLSGLWGTRVVSVEAGCDGVLGQVEVTFKPKNGRERLVPLNQHAQVALRDLAAWRAAEADGHAVTAWRNRLGLPPPVWLVPDLSGAPSRASPLRLLHEACDAANVERCRIHDFRHTFATRLRASGVALDTVKDLLGHANIEDTMRYAHFGIQEGFTAVDRLGGTGQRA